MLIEDGEDYNPRDFNFEGIRTFGADIFDLNIDLDTL
jgi:hypothetical protein